MGELGLGLSEVGAAVCTALIGDLREDLGVEKAGQAGQAGPVDRYNNNGSQPQGSSHSDFSS